MSPSNRPGRRRGAWDSPHLAELGRAFAKVPWQWRLVYLTVTVVFLAGGLAAGWWLP